VIGGTHVPNLNHRVGGKAVQEGRLLTRQRGQKYQAFLKGEEDHGNCRKEKRRKAGLNIPWIRGGVENRKGTRGKLASEAGGTRRQLVVNGGGGVIGTEVRTG